jgi:hypothetical protein
MFVYSLLNIFSLVSNRLYYLSTIMFIPVQILPQLINTATNYIYIEQLTELIKASIIA